MAALRVIQWATGGVGRAAIEGVLDHPDLELVGCWVHSADKDGVDVGTLLGPRPDRRHRHHRRRRAARHRRRLRGLQPAVRRPRGGDPHPRVGQERRHPARLVLPARRRRGRGSTRCAATAGVTLHGTGIHPGGITERFPLVLSALSGSVTPRAGRGVLRHPHLRRPRRDPRLDAVRHARPRRPAPASWPTPSAPGSASRCGWWPTSSASTSTRSCARPTRWRSPPRRSTRPSGRSSPGLVAAQRFRWEGLVDGEPVDHRRGQLADGRGAPRPAVGVRARGRALRGRGHRRPRPLVTFKKLHPRVDRRGPRAQPRHRRHRHALRERRALRVRRPARGCSPTSTSRWWRDGPPPTSIATPATGKGTGR